MKRWLKRGLWLLAALFVIGVIAGFVYRDELIRLRRVNTLFEPDKIVANFSNMKELFWTARVPRGGPVFEFAAAPRPPPKTFSGGRGEMEVAAFLEETKTTSLLVVRAGAIEFEQYYLGTGAEDRRISWSVAKSVLSALIGIARGEGAIDSLDDPVVKYAPQLAGSGYEDATVRNVATMASGVAFDEDYLEYDSDINRLGRELALGGSLDAFAAGLTETTGPPGGAWRYVSIDSHVLGMVLRGATGRGVPGYMSDKLWSKIGAEADAYYITDEAGAAFVLGGLNARTRDYARFGRLYLEDGGGEGARVLPEGWVAESTRASAPAPATPNRGFGYAYQWWLPPAPDGEIFATGIYGQYLYIDRRRDVVIVKTSANRGFREDDRQDRSDTIALFRAIARR